MIRHHVRSVGQNKILAIKLVRELTLTGLKEAKELVESQASFVVVVDGPSQARVAQEAKLLGIEFDPPLDPNAPAQHDESGDATSGYGVRLMSSSSQLVHIIAVIKLVRELTGLGLKEAKELVERGGQLIRTELSRSEAEQIVRQFAEINARAELVEPGAAGSGGKSASRIRHDFEDEANYDF